MTPEQKAAELINKMYYTQSSPASWVQAKECALIAINEMIKTSEEAILFKQSKRDWLQEVKQEIEKL